MAYLAYRMSVDDILREWPELQRYDIYEALEYAAWATQGRWIPLTSERRP